MIDVRSMRVTVGLCDREDEVNIALFHPDAGQGIVYGTKVGKVRKFQRLVDVPSRGDVLLPGSVVVHRMLDSQ